MVRQKKKTAFLSAVYMLLAAGLFFTCRTSDVVVRAAENAAEPELLVPLGRAVGVTLNMDGVLVVSVSEMKDGKGATVAPAKDAGLREGDLIKTLNGEELHSVQELTSALDEIGHSAVRIQVERDGQTLDSMLLPAQERESGAYKIAAWVKDAASGIGTITFCDPQTGRFGALGHSITDSATGEAVSLSGGSIVKSAIVAVDRGERGKPGELKGVFTENKDRLGTVLENDDCGLFGQLEKDSGLMDGEAVLVAEPGEVRTGAAVILANVEGDTVGRYSVEIQRLNRGGDSHKDMVIKVTDPALLEKTGGIVQGMSGSPILQDGKLVGAVTHVFVNDPTRGYGIFIENMLN